MDIKRLLEEFRNSCQCLTQNLNEVSFDNLDKTSEKMLQDQINELNISMSTLEGVLDEGKTYIQQGQKLQAEFNHMIAVTTSISKEVDSRVSYGLLVLQPEQHKTSIEGASMTPTVATEVKLVESVPTTNKNSKTIPQVAHIKDEELNNISSYMKGRITLVAINKFIDAFNSTIALKYQLLKKPRKQLVENEKKRCNTYKQLETKDTKGCYFCTVDDLRDEANIKINNSTWSKFTILRHCNRIKEIRGPKQIIRYAVQIAENV